MMKKPIGLVLITIQILLTSCNTGTDKIEYGSHEGKQVTIFNKKIYYEEYGSGTPLILLSGGGIDRSIKDFENCIPGLAKYYRVIAPDTPGQGRSEQADTLTYSVLLEFTSRLIDSLKLDRLLRPAFNDELENAVIPPPVEPASQNGDLWLLGPHRLLCGDCTNADDVARVLSGAQPQLLITDPPYGISLDSEWRDRAGLNSKGPAEASYMKRRTEGHTNTSISEDTRADWNADVMPRSRLASLASLHIGPANDLSIRDVRCAQ